MDIKIPDIKSGLQKNCHSNTIFILKDTLWSTRVLFFICHTCVFFIFLQFISIYDLFCQWYSKLSIQPTYLGCFGKCANWIYTIVLSNEWKNNAYFHAAINKYHLYNDDYSKLGSLRYMETPNIILIELHW